MPATVRPAIRAEAPLVADLLRRAGFGSTVGRLLDYPFGRPAGEGVRRRATAARWSARRRLASFGATGWIGALGVEPAARRRGLGRALTEECVEWLRERGAQTVLLYATERAARSTSASASSPRAGDAPGAESPARAAA